MKRLSRFTQSTVFLLLLGLVFCFPVPLGANRPWFWSPIQMAIVISLMLTLFARIRRDDTIGSLIDENKVLVILFLVWLGYMLVQIVPLPEPLLSLIAVEKTELFTERGTLWGGISIDSGKSLEQVGLYFSYILLLSLVVLLLQSRRRLKILCFVILAAGLLQFFIAMIILFRFPDGLIWMGEKIGGERVSGSFINRNHFGLFLVMCLGIGLGLSRYYRRQLSRQSIRGLIASIDGKVIFTTAINGLLFIALLYSNSRGAFMAFAGSILVTFFLLKQPDDDTVDWKKILSLVFLVLLGVLYFGDGGFFGRLLSSNVLQEERLLQSVISLNMLSDFLWLGAGTGTYGLLLPLYHDGTLRLLIYDHAHNDYLELLIEQGIFGFILFFTALVLIMRKLRKAYFNRKDPLARSIIYGVFIAVLAFSFHSMVEFNFYIPANAAYLFIILGIGLAAARMPKNSRRRRRQEILRT